MSRIPVTQTYPLPPGDSVAGGTAMPGKSPVESCEPVDIPDYFRFARARISPMAAEYLRGGAAAQRLAERNQAGYQNLRLRPNVLVDVSKVDTRTTMAGQEMSFPILLAAMGDQKLLHPEGELATAKGAGLTGATCIVSATATVGLAEIGRAAAAPWWFQFYPQADRGLTRELVQRAQAAGCTALVVAIDGSETSGQAALPLGMDRPILSDPAIDGRAADSSAAWQEIDWLRSLTSLPLWAKGIIDPEEAARAVQLGLQGVIVSNRGARNPDRAPATIDALGRVVTKVAARCPVLVEGGIRRGTDVLKALGLGAAAVLIGGPYLHGLALNGADGVAHVIRILRRELEMAMASTGRPTIAAIDSSVLWR